MAEFALWALAICLVLVGVAGTILPALPGVPLVFGGLVLAAWIDQFAKVGWGTLSLLFIMTIAALIIEVVMSRRGAKKIGASKLALFFALLGSFLGMFAGVIGILVGPFVGALIGEFIAKRDLMRAAHVGWKSWVGFILGSALKIAIVIAMIAFFALVYAI